MIFDTDILIWTLRGNIHAAEVIDHSDSRFISLMTHFELLDGLRDKRELAALSRLIRRFESVPMSQEIGEVALNHMERLALKVHLSPADAIIAATALHLDLPLCTGNVKHFRHVTGLSVIPFRP